MFSHEDTQECFEWTSTVTGIDAWKKSNFSQNYNLSKPSSSVQGPVSTKSMSIIYSCNKEKCLVNCPCSICCDEKNSCKLLCRDEICDECNIQCPTHQIKLPRVFNPETDHYTLMTNKMDRYKYAIPHAGIPVSCSQCTNDLREHQIFHLVFHTRCRYCRYLLRPFELQSIITLEDFKEAEEELKRKEDRTCSSCTSLSLTKAHRLDHEATVHKMQCRGYMCKSCKKMYSNTTSLNYHIFREHGDKNEASEFQCNHCQSVFVSNEVLKRHVETIHPNPQSTIFKCDKCDQSFSREDSYMRHLRQTHYKFKANLDFVENMDAFLLNKCDQCEKSFKRKYKLKRHVDTVNSETKKKFDCSECEKKFSRSDNLRRHVRDEHSN